MQNAPPCGPTLPFGWRRFAISEADMVAEDLRTLPTHCDMPIAHLTVMILHSGYHGYPSRATLA